MELVSLENVLSSGLRAPRSAGGRSVVEKRIIFFFFFQSKTGKVFPSEGWASGCNLDSDNCPFGGICRVGTSYREGKR